MALEIDKMTRMPGDEAFRRDGKDRHSCLSISFARTAFLQCADLSQLWSVATCRNLWQLNDG